MKPSNDQPLLPPDFFADRNYLPAKQNFMLGVVTGIAEDPDWIPGPERADLASKTLADLMATIELTEQCRFSVPDAYERLPELQAAQASLRRWL